MITWIGLCAGEIWRYLDEHEGRAPFKTLLSEIDAPPETMLMAVGWLAREGHIFMEGNLPECAVELNPRPLRKES